MSGALNDNRLKFRIFAVTFLVLVVGLVLALDLRLPSQNDYEDDDETEDDSRALWFRLGRLVDSAAT